MALALCPPLKTFFAMLTDKMATGVVLSWLGCMVLTVAALHPDDIAYVQTELSPSGLEIQATDGTVFIEAVGSRVRGVLKCSVSHDKDAVTKLLGNQNVVTKTIGESKVKDVVSLCEQRHQFSYRVVAPAALPPQPFAPEKTAQPAGSGSSLLIVPGTKWCGEGNVANSYDDLGTSRQTDACCRTHDHCPYFIDAFQSKYHYQNLYPWTLSLCDCDKALYQCLKSVNNSASNEVGIGFFGVLDVECFTFTRGEYCAKYHWSHLWCEKKTTGPEAVVKKLGLHW
ncbi:uncharacterized protein [Haliotis asinina]|uniref:uncharacterized protein isoform X1 n=2 Tax=Haliotis asinina TaxID=109174 RepID=UPI003531F423